MRVAAAFLFAQCLAFPAVGAPMGSVSWSATVPAVRRGMVPLPMVVTGTTMTC